MLQTLQVTSEVARETPLTLAVFGHQVVRTPEAYGLLLRTQELGEVVFSLPPAILKMLIADLIRLSSSPPALPHRMLPTSYMRAARLVPGNLRLLRN